MHVEKAILTQSKLQGSVRRPEQQALYFTFVEIEGIFVMRMYTD
jgi:hypothetical protein